jgi:hypothetical protein
MHKERPNLSSLSDLGQAEVPLLTLIDTQTFPFPSSISFSKMSPKKRGRPIKKDIDIPTNAISDNEVSAPPTKKTRGNSKIEIPGDGGSAESLRTTRATNAPAKAPAKKGSKTSKGAKVNDEVADNDAAEEAVVVDTIITKAPPKSRTAAEKSNGKEKKEVSDEGAGEDALAAKTPVKAKVPSKKGNEKSKEEAKQDEVDENGASAANPALDGTQSPRKGKTNSLFQKPFAKPEKDAQVIKTENLTIPVDESCPYGGE